MIITSSTVLGLIASLEAATEGNLELDCAMREATGYSDVGNPHPYTQYIDTALTLMPEDCYPTILTWNSMGSASGYCEMKIRGPFEKDGWHSNVSGKAKTPALALCIAVVKAHTRKSEL